MSFFLAWLILILAGMVITLVERVLREYKPKEDSFFVYTVSILVLVVFLCVSVGLLCEIGWSDAWGYDNPVFGRINEYIFNIIKDIPGFDDYYARHPFASSTDYMFSSGFEFLKSGVGGNWLTNWLGNLFGFEVPFDRLLPWNAYDDYVVLVQYQDFNITVSWLKDFVAAYPDWTTMDPATLIDVGGIQVSWAELKPILEPILTADGLAQHPMFLFGGVLMVCTYPGFLWAGTQLGYMVWGRKKGDLGILGLL